MSCQGSNSHIIELNIDPSKHALDEKYQDTLVKVCGLATKEFENVHITNHRAVGSKGPPKGYGVEWLEREPYTTKPEQRCVTGYVRPICGWKDFRNEDLICASTGHSYKWVIVQKTLSRD